MKIFFCQSGLDVWYRCLLLMSCVESTETTHESNVIIKGVKTAHILNVTQDKLIPELFSGLQ